MLFSLYTSDGKIDPDEVDPNLVYQMPQLPRFAAELDERVRSRQGLFLFKEFSKLFFCKAKTTTSQWSPSGILLLGFIRRTKTSSVTSIRGWSILVGSSGNTSMPWKLKTWKMRITSIVSERFLSSWRFPNTIKSVIGKSGLINSSFISLKDIGKQYKLTVRHAILTTISSWSKKLPWRKTTSWWKSSSSTKRILVFMCPAGESRFLWANNDCHLFRYNSNVTARINMDEIAAPYKGIPRDIIEKIYISYYP